MMTSIRRFSIATGRACLQKRWYIEAQTALFGVIYSHFTSSNTFPVVLPL
jgi:hypothetical protein